MHFVKVDKNAEWLMQTVLGTSQKVGLRRTTLLETLRAKLRPFGSTAAVAVVEDALEYRDVADDPMSALADIDDKANDDFVTPTKTNRRRTCQQVTEVLMPQRDPRSHPDCTDTRKVRLLPLGTNSVWIAVADVPWMLTWLADEVESGGVAPLTDEAVQLETNTSVEGVHIRWSFDGAWEAIILAGPKKGYTTKSYVAYMSPAKWAQCPQLRDSTFEDSSASERKAATKAFLEWHMRAVLVPGAVVVQGSAVTAGQDDTAVAV